MLVFQQNTLFIVFSVHGFHPSIWIYAWISVTFSCKFNFIRGHLSKNQLLLVWFINCLFIFLFKHLFYDEITAACGNQSRDHKRAKYIKTVVKLFWTHFLSDGVGTTCAFMWTHSKLLLYHKSISWITWHGDGYCISKLNVM